MLKRAHMLPLDVTIFLQEKNSIFTTRFGFEHLGGCILIDGSIGSYTAALDEDYEGNPGERGVLYENTRVLSRFVEEAHVAGVSSPFHAIGPRAIDMVLDAYERALRRFRATITATASSTSSSRPTIRSPARATSGSSSACSRRSSTSGAGPDGMYALAHR